MLTSSVALLLACAAFVAYDVSQFRREMVESVSSLAEVVGNNMAAAIDFNDPATATQTLTALRGEPNIAVAYVHGPDGSNFATYVRDGVQPLLAAPHLLATQPEFTARHLYLLRPITQRGEQIGTIELIADLSELQERLWRYAGIVGLVLIASLLAALVLSGRLQKLISDPILHLAEVARSVALEKNYSVRATKQSNDELGQLVDGFNEMLAQIQERDRALQDGRSQLETRVAQRTGELASSVALLNATLEASADGIVAADLNGRVTTYNKRFAEIWSLSDRLARPSLAELAELTASQLKDSTLFLTRLGQLLTSPEREDLDVLEFKDGRVIERLSRPQYIGDNCIGNVITYRDITERKQADAMLRRTEKLYRRAIAGAGAVPYSSDFKTRSYLFMGEGIQQLIGYRPEEMTPGLWRELIQESIMLGETAGLEKSAAAQKVAAGILRHWRCDMRVTTRNGETRWISDASVQNLDEAGTPIGSMGILQDITERKQAEISALAFSKLGRNLSGAASREAAAKIISEVADELFGWDAFSVQMYSEKDDMMHSLFEADTVNGQRIYDTAPDPRRTTELHRRILTHGGERLLRAGAGFLPGAIPFGNPAQPSASLMFVPIRDGAVALGILSIHSYRPNAYGEPDLGRLQALADQCSGALARISADEARRISETQFRLVWNTSADGMRLTNRAGTVLMVNDAYCRLVEMTKAEVEGRSLTLYQRAENAGLILREYQERIESGIFQWQVETEVTLWNSRKVWFEASNSILNLPGQPALLLSIFRDITERKAAGAELEKVHRQLMEASRRGGMAEIATNVLHNVGNVLNSVNISTGLIVEHMKKSRSANLDRVVALLREHAHDLGEFITRDPNGRHVPAHLAQLSRQIAADQAAIIGELDSLRGNVEHIKEIVAMQQNYAMVGGVKEMINVVNLVEDSMRMNEGAFSRHRIKVIREFENVPPMNVEKHKILQILVNLIRNAKYACEESERADKRLTMRVSSGGGCVKIAVIDNGVGISPQNLTRIFSHGFTTRKGGHGFGLHSGALAAKEMGGSLTVYSKGAGQGAAFTLELPLPKPEELT